MVSSPDRYCPFLMANTGLKKCITCIEQYVDRPSRNVQCATNLFTYATILFNRVQVTWRNGLEEHFDDERGRDLNNDPGLVRQRVWEINAGRRVTGTHAPVALFYLQNRSQRYSVCQLFLVWVLWPMCLYSVYLLLIKRPRWMAGLFSSYLPEAKLSHDTLCLDLMFCLEKHMPRFGCRVRLTIKLVHSCFFTGYTQVGRTRWKVSKAVESVGGTSAILLVSSLPRHMCGRVFLVPARAHHWSGDTRAALHHIPVIVRTPECLSNFTKTQKKCLNLNCLNLTFQSVVAPKDANCSLCTKNKQKWWGFVWYAYAISSMLYCCRIN